MPLIAVTVCKKFEDYRQAVIHAGAEPRELQSGMPIDEALAGVDGLVLTGGEDVDPSLYGETPHETVTDVNRARDDFEVALIRKARERDLPLLAIHTPETARRFLRGYGFDPDRPSDLHRALAIHGEALAFIHRHFLSGTGLAIPDAISHPSSLSELLLLASDETEAGRTLQPWACAVLRVMHTIAHCDDDLRLRYFREIRGQIQ